MRKNVDNELELKNDNVVTNVNNSDNLNQIISNYLKCFFTQVQTDWCKMMNTGITSELWWRHLLNTKSSFSTKNGLKISYNELKFKHAVVLSTDKLEDDYCQAMVITPELFISCIVLLKNDCEPKLRTKVDSDEHWAAELMVIEHLISRFCTQNNVESDYQIGKLSQNLESEIIHIFKPLQAFEGVEFPPSIKITNQNFQTSFKSNYAYLIMDELKKLKIEVISQVEMENKSIIEFKYQQKILKVIVDSFGLWIEGDDFDQKEYYKFSKYKGYDPDTKIAICGNDNGYDNSKLRKILKNEFELLDQYINIKSICPLGTVISLKSEQLKENQFVITERFARKATRSKEYYEYKGVFYPTGSIERCNGILFNNEDIAEIYQRGYSTINEVVFVDKMFHLVDEMNLKKAVTLNTNKFERNIKKFFSKISNAN